MENSLDRLENKFVESLYIDVEDMLFARIRKELQRTGQWDQVGEENLGEMVSDMLHYLYFQENR